jgi:hypothetical protein
MVNVMDAPPERLYRPDISITKWRALCESAPPNGLAVPPANGDSAGGADGGSGDVPGPGRKAPARARNRREH